MSVHVLLNLFNEFGEKIRCEALPNILSIASEFNKFNSTGARMQDSIHHDTKIAFNLQFLQQNVNISL